jgi:hypothetical protein
MNNIFKKTIMVTLAAVLVFAAFPMTSAFAQGVTPPTGGITNTKLEQVWARELKNYDRIGKFFTDNSLISKIQDKLDKAAAAGKDVSAVQAALNAFEAALKSAKPTYDSISAIVTAHQGFDATGHVTDAVAAKNTVKEMHTNMVQLKTVMNGTGKALMDAIKAFRDANKSAKPSGSGI